MMDADVGSTRSPAATSALARLWPGRQVPTHPLIWDWIARHPPAICRQRTWIFRVPLRSQGLSRPSKQYHRWRFVKSTELGKYRYGSPPPPGGRRPRLLASAAHNPPHPPGRPPPMAISLRPPGHGYLPNNSKSEPIILIRQSFL
jgi:hypothetical protein